jgi:hypothetical protein
MTGRVMVAGLALLASVALGRGSIEGLPASAATTSDAAAVGAGGTTASDDEPTAFATSGTYPVTVSCAKPPDLTRPAVAGGVGNLAASAA